MSGVVFKSISIEAWRQIGFVEIEFHPRVTILTGANGAGKSTIISLISGHFGYQKNLLATPKKRSIFSTGLFSFWRKNKIHTRKIEDSHQTNIGVIKYSHDMSCEMSVPIKSQLHYNISFENQEPIAGIHIDSHRPPIIYRGVSQLNLSSPNIRDFFKNLNNELTNYYRKGVSDRGTIYHIKSSLIAMSIFGHGNPTMEPKPELLDLFRDFEIKLKGILPKSLGFQRLKIESPEVILVTETGDFILDAASGGILKLIVIVWQIFFFSKINNGTKYVVTMDEPENHLHPSMQREFLANFVNAFPEAQFIVATHSPFIVSSMKDSNVYALQYKSTEISEQSSLSYKENITFSRASKVYSEKLDVINKSGSASEILRNVLGLTTTIPDWVEDRVDEIILEYENSQITPEILSSIYKRLREEGLSTQYPRVTQALVQD